MSHTVPLYQATQSLDVNYIFRYHEIEHANFKFFSQPVHDMLYQSCCNLLTKRDELRYTTNIVDDVNLATAAITLLFTDTTTDEGYLGEDVSSITLPLEVNRNKPILTVSDQYQNVYSLKKDINQKKIPKNKQKRDRDFNQMLDNNIRGFYQVSSSFYSSHAAITPDDVNAKIANSNFHETFHHSEQGVMFGLSSDYTIKGLVKTMRANDASYFYGAVLDIYSFRTLCGNCNVGLLGLQYTHQQGFLADFITRLESKDIQTRVGKNTFLDVRVSASKASKNTTLEPYRLCDDKKVVHKRKDVLTPRPILQALNRDIRGHNQKAPAYYYGNFFSSRAFSCKKLENELLKEKTSVLDRSVVKTF